MSTCKPVTAPDWKRRDGVSGSAVEALAASMILAYEVVHDSTVQPLDSDDETFQLSCYATQNLALANWIWLQRSEQDNHSNRSFFGVLKHNFQPLKPLRQWLDHLQVNDRQLAHRLCQLIPAQCPFERDIQLFGKTLFHIPPLCKLNPLYDELVYLRFRALSYLADDCGEDVSAYT